MTRQSIAVVGAGIVGCLAARELAARSPESSVVVLDRDLAGCGATRRSAGLHFPRGATERVRHMAAYSQDYYDALLTERPTLPIYSLRMSVVAPGASAEAVERAYLDRAQLTRVDSVPGEIVRLPPGCRVWRGDGCQHADVHALTQALTRDLRSRVTIREGVRVTGVLPRADGVLLRLGTGDTLAVDRVVIAPGPWLDCAAWKDLVAPLGARVKRVVAIHLQQAPSARDHAVVFHDEDAFLLPLRDRGHWLFSYTCTDWDVDPDAVAEGLSASMLEEARRCLGAFSPGLAERCSAGRVFCDAYSANGEPVIQALDPAGRVVFAGAANGSGYRLAPAIAAAAGDLLLEPSQPRSFT